MAGRRSILTKKARDAIVTELREGGLTRDAAAIAGVCVDTVRRWQREGARAMRDRVDRNIAIPRNRRAQVEFAREVAKAKAMARKDALGCIRGAMADSWQAAAWYLERTAPGDYGTKTGVEISGPEGGPVQVDTGGSLKDAIAAAIAATPGIIADDIEEDDD